MRGSVQVAGCQSWDGCDCAAGPEQDAEDDKIEYVAQETCGFLGRGPWLGGFDIQKAVQRGDEFFFLEEMAPKITRTAIGKRKTLTVNNFVEVNHGGKSWAKKR